MGNTNPDFAINEKKPISQIGAEVHFLNEEAKERAL